jgi:hypothetical protein
LKTEKLILRASGIVLTPRGFYGFGRTESVVGGEKFKGALGSPAVVADCANAFVEGKGYF